MTYVDWYKDISRQEWNLKEPNHPEIQEAKKSNAKSIEDAENVEGTDWAVQM